MKNLIIIIIFSALSFIFSTCNKNNTSNEDHNDSEHHDIHENNNLVTLTKEQAKSIKLELGKIEKKQLTASLKANGILNVPNQNKATITSLMGGVIKSILVQSGNNVNKGQIIATIANTNFITMQEEFLSTSSKLNLAEIEYKRQQELQASNATALKTLQTIETEVKTLKIRKSSLQKQLELIGINTASLSNDNMQPVVNITSPISGVISSISVNIGTYVDANNAVAEVIDNSQLHLDLFIYEKDLGKIKEGQTIHFTLTNNPGREYDAKIYAISNTFEQNTKAISLHAMVEGDKTGLINGMNITAIVSLENATVNAVPNEAIVNYMGQDYIFVISNASNEEVSKEIETHNHEHTHDHTHNDTIKVNNNILKFERIPIRKGTSDIGYSEITILKDMPTNSTIVTKGSFFILAKMTNTGEHEH